MNSQRARNYIVSAALVVAVLFLSSLAVRAVVYQRENPRLSILRGWDERHGCRHRGWPPVSRRGFSGYEDTGLTSRAGIRLRRFSNPPAAATGNPLSHQPVTSFVAVR